MKYYACLLVLVFSTIVQAETYSWTDSSGSMHFIENLSSVPAKYLKQATSNARGGIKYTGDSQKLEEDYKKSADRQNQYILDRKKARRQAQEESNKKENAEYQRNMAEINRYQEMHRQQRFAPAQEKHTDRESHSSEPSVKDPGPCMGDCDSEQGICISGCGNNGQCIGNCAAVQGRCVSRCF